jgi:hypothetical protein
MCFGTRAVPQYLKMIFCVDGNRSRIILNWRRGRWSVHDLKNKNGYGFAAAVRLNFDVLKRRARITVLVRQVDSMHEARHLDPNNSRAGKAVKLKSAHTYVRVMSVCASCRLLPVIERIGPARAISNSRQLEEIQYA